VVIVRPPQRALIDAVKALADRHRDELGFHTRQAFIDSARRGELLVATEADAVVGFVRFHKRRDGVATLYEIVTAPGRRRRGVARQLVAAVVEEGRLWGARLLRLSCPAELPANAFYQAVGFTRTSPRSLALGRTRHPFPGRWVSRSAPFPPEALLRTKYSRIIIAP
jgi:GNAT superfamily N-acetyltransferase